MTCRDVAGLLPRFFDAELDPREMRAVALHSSHCPECGRELRSLENLQALLSNTIQARIDDMDLSGLWVNIEARLPAPSLSPWAKLGRWWKGLETRAMLPLPALAAAAVVAALAFYFLARPPQPGTAPETPQIARIQDNEATIDSLEAESDSVAVMSDPETRTTILWVSEDGPLEDVYP